MQLVGILVQSKPGSKRRVRGLVVAAGAGPATALGRELQPGSERRARYANQATRHGKGSVVARTVGEPSVVVAAVLSRRVER
jgi:hypothetical protein